MKGKEESPERMVNEIETSNLSGIDFKVTVIRILMELSGNYKEPSGNYISMKKDIETTEIMNKNQEEIKNTISEMKNTLEGIKSRLDEAED